MTSVEMVALLVGNPRKDPVEFFEVPLEDKMKSMFPLSWTKTPSRCELQCSEALKLFDELGVWGDENEE